MPADPAGFSFDRERQDSASSATRPPEHEAATCSVTSLMRRARSARQRASDSPCRASRAIRRARVRRRSISARTQSSCAPSRRRLDLEAYILRDRLCARDRRVRRARISRVLHNAEKPDPLDGARAERLSVRRPGAIRALLGHLRGRSRRSIVFNAAYRAQPLDQSQLAHVPARRTLAFPIAFARACAPAARIGAYCARKRSITSGCPPVPEGGNMEGIYLSDRRGPRKTPMDSHFMSCSSPRSRARSPDRLPCRRPLERCSWSPG